MTKPHNVNPAMNKLTPLEAMGFEPDEIETIVDICAHAQAVGLGPIWNPVDLGKFIMSQRLLPDLNVTFEPTPSELVPVANRLGLTIQPRQRL